MGRKIRYSRPKILPPETLLDFLCARFPYLTRDAWERHLAAGHLSVSRKVNVTAPLTTTSGKVHDGGSYILCQGDEIHFDPPRELEPEVDERMEIVHSDAAVLVCAKSGNLPVAEGGRYSGNTLVGLLQRRDMANPQPQRKRERDDSNHPPNQRERFAVPQDKDANAESEQMEDPSTYLHPVHRLDKETSGLVVLARQITAARNLSAQFEVQSAHLASALEQHTVSGTSELSPDIFDALLHSVKSVSKSYAAVLAGTAPEGAVYIVSDRIGLLSEDPAAHLETHRKLKKLKMACFPTARRKIEGEENENDCLRGRPACSRVRILASDAAVGASIARVDILTGRTHQIRLHCAQLGFPVMGDKLYESSTPGHRGGCRAVDDDVYLQRARENVQMLHIGTTRRLRVRRHLLHAAELAFVHPIRGERVVFVADPRAWFLRDVEDNGGNAVRSLRELLDKAIEASEWGKNTSHTHD